MPLCYLKRLIFIEAGFRKLWFSQTAVCGENLFLRGSSSYNSIEGDTRQWQTLTPVNATSKLCVEWGLWTTRRRKEETLLSSMSSRTTKSPSLLVNFLSSRKQYSKLVVATRVLIIKELEKNSRTSVTASYRCLNKEIRTPVCEKIVQGYYCLRNIKSERIKRSLTNLQNPLCLPIIISQQK